MLTTGIVRIGNEPVIRFTPNGKPCLQLSLAYNYGRKNEEGSYPTQWIDAAMWGERTEKLVPMLKKGDRIYVELRDVHLDKFTRHDGSTGASIKATLERIELIDYRRQAQESKPSSNSFDDMKDDIPF